VHRTQLYLDADLHRALAAAASRENKTLSAVIRERLRVALRRDLRPALGLALDAAFGLWKDRDDLPNTEAYIRSLRRSTRGERFGTPGAKGRRR
jgi:hypothetical protein